MLLPAAKADFFFFFFLIVGLKSWKAKHKTYSLEIHFSHDEQ